MRFYIRDLRPCLFYLILVAGIVSVNETFAASITANARTRFGSGNTTYGEQEVGGVLLPPNGSTGLQEAGNSHLRSLAVATSSLASNAVGGYSGWIGGSVIDSPTGNGGTVWNLSANTQTRVEDRITVSSATLPAGIPVEVQFSLNAASSTFADHSDPNSNMNNNFGFVNSSISGNVRVATNTANRFDILAGDNQIIRDTTGDIPAKNGGMLDPNSPQFDFVMNVEVGQELIFFLDIDTNASGKLSPITVSLSPITLENSAGIVYSAISVAFGASATVGDVELKSELFGGLFPAASAANAANAAIGLPANPIPEPSCLVLMASTVWLLTCRYKKGQILSTSQHLKVRSFSPNFYRLDP